MKRSAADYALALYEIVSKKPEQASKAVRGLRDALQAANQNNLLPQILTNLEAIEDEKLGRVRVTAEVPQPLTDAQEKQIVTAIEAMLKGKTVLLHQKINASLIGGLRLQIGDKVIDHSVKHKLAQLAAKL